MTRTTGATRISGRLLLDGELVPGALTLAAGRIAEVEQLPAGAADARLSVVCPGLIDLHVHGFGGADPLDGLDAMAAALARAGTTAFQPTLFPAAPDALGATCERLAPSLGLESREGRARAVGLHLEGPFVNPRAAGALPVADLAAPSLEGLRAILGPASGDGRGVRTVTLAPELAGASELVAELERSGVRVSLGHSLASAAEARAALRAGAGGATHLYNAMRPIHHREAGLAGVALTEDLLFAEIIGDLVHVGPEAFDLALRARGPLGLCLVSDALPGAGTGCEVFHWHGREHLVRAGTSYYPPAAEGGEPRLCGSAMSQLEMVRRLVERGVVGLADALTMACEAPARALGLEHDLGRLVAGARADVLVLAPDGLALERVLVGGKEPR